jgi:hypothetical protein
VRSVLTSAAAILFIGGCAKETAQPLEDHSHGATVALPALRVPWTLTILDMQRRVIGQLTVRFTGDNAPSCRGGDWKRIVVLNYRQLGEPAFPGNDQLSYITEGGTLTVGRNEVCDGYVMLKGDLTSTSFSGDYFTLGLGGTSQLGYVQGAPNK